MRRLRNEESGLIPLLIFVIAVVIGVIIMAFLRVKSQQGL